MRMPPRSFPANPAYRPQLAKTSAGAVVLAERDAEACPTAALITADPYAAFARIALELHPAPAARPGVHASAVIGEGCRLPESCEIGPGVVLGSGVVLGERVIVGTRTVVGDGVNVGEDSRLFPGVICTRVRVGRLCPYPGAVIGADPGFARGATVTSRCPRSAAW